MNAAAEQLEFAPPPTPGLLRAVGLAILAHGFLVAALTWGVQWRQSPSTVSAEAELWSAIPQQAAPPPPVVAPVAPPPPPAPAAAPARVPDPQIALERERQRLQKQQAEERQAQERRRQAQERQREQDKRQAAEKLKAEQEARRKEDLRKQQEARRIEERKAQQEARRLEEQRLANLQRLAGLAGSTGAATATGRALQSSGPSSNYGGILQKAVRDHVNVGVDLPGNPLVEIEIVAAPDGTILNSVVRRSSGNRAFDDAVLRGLGKMRTLPRDTDGRIHSPLLMAYRHRD